MTERETDRQTDRDKERATDRHRQTVNWCFTPSQTNKQRKTMTGRQRQRHKDIDRRRHRDRLSETGTDRQKQRHREKSVIFSSLPVTYCSPCSFPSTDFLGLRSLRENHTALASHVATNQTSNANQSRHQTQSAEASDGTVDYPRLRPDLIEEAVDLAGPELFTSKACVPILRFVLKLADLSKTWFK